MEPSTARIALLLDQIESDYQLDVLIGVRRVLGRSGARLLVVAGGPLGPEGEPHERNFVYDYLTEGRVDGLIVLSGSLGNLAGVGVVQKLLERLKHVPTLTLGATVEGVPGVSVDNRSGVGKLVAHMVEVHGTRRFAFVLGPSGSAEATARFEGFRDALLSHGLELRSEWLLPGGFLREDGINALETLLVSRGVRPGSVDALVCVNDESALGVMEALHKRGIAVPRPLSVVGFDDAPGAQIANPPLTTISQRVMDQAEAAASILLDYLERGVGLTSKVLAASLVLRDSCGCRSHAFNDSHDLPFERPKVARSLRLALIERRAAILPQLTRAARGRMAGVHDWEGRLVDSLSAQLDSDEGGAFYWELERLTRIHAVNDGDPIICHDVLTELRLQTLVCGEVEPGLRPRLEDLFQEARVILARVGSSVVREHADALSQRMRHFTQACLSQVGDPDEARLAETLSEHLPLLGIQSYCLTRLSPDGHGLIVIASRTAGLRTPEATRLPFKSMGHDLGLEKASTSLLLPLTYQGRRLGTVVFSWGAADPHVYEEVRALLGLALFAVERARAG
jgi:DNA-binding LacI/PurR family transcriptional regulator